jgi:hypothetical protein
MTVVNFVSHIQWITFAEVLSNDAHMFYPVATYNITSKHSYTFQLNGNPSFSPIERKSNFKYSKSI